MQVRWLVPWSIGAALLLGACGEASSGSNSSVLNLDGSNYATLPPAQSTTSSSSSVPAGPQPGEQEYTVQAGDFPIAVAKKFGVSLDALNQANAATPGYSVFYQGLKIRIPAGGTPAASTTTVAGSGTTVAGATTTLAGGGGTCAAGSYTIKDGDYPIKVAKNFNVTVAQLDAANANTAGYSAFYVGLKIVIPPKSGC